MRRIIERDVAVFADAEQGNLGPKGIPLGGVARAFGGEVGGFAAQPFEAGGLHLREQVVHDEAAKRIGRVGLRAYVFIEMESGEAVPRDTGFGGKRGESFGLRRRRSKHGTRCGLTQSFRGMRGGDLPQFRAVAAHMHVQETLFHIPNASIHSVEESEIYSAIGEDGFTRLIGAFYRQIPSDDVLGPLYPEQDLEGAEKRLRDFLIFRFGGPARYIEERGHPRLRMRHAPFPVNRAARDRWMTIMDNAFQEARLPSEAEQALRRFFDSTATAMMNSL